MDAALVARDFTVPQTLTAGRYRLEVLRPAVAELDYDAVVSSRARLRQVFSADDAWPEDELTLADNVNDLRRHEAEFHAREAFAYTVLSTSGDVCLGCVYIYPATVPGYDCEVYLWVRDSVVDMDEQLFLDVRAWLERHWPFERPVFPGREIPWAQWQGTRHT